jgi:hypothetical protein
MIYACSCLVYLLEVLLAWLKIEFLWSLLLFQLNMMKWTGNGCTTPIDDPWSMLMACMLFSKWRKPTRMRRDSCAVQPKDYSNWGELHIGDVQFTLWRLWLHQSERLCDKSVPILAILFGHSKQPQNNTSIHKQGIINKFNTETKRRRRRNK